MYYVLYYNILYYIILYYIVRCEAAPCVAEAAASTDDIANRRQAECAEQATQEQSLHTKATGVQHTYNTTRPRSDHLCTSAMECSQKPTLLTMQSSIPTRRGRKDG